jgi:hypothetical protein
MAYVFFANEAWHIQNFYENEALHFFRGPRPGGAGAEFGRQPTSQWGHFFSDQRIENRTHVSHGDVADQRTGAGGPGERCQQRACQRGAICSSQCHVDGDERAEHRSL